MMHLFLLKKKIHWQKLWWQNILLLSKKSKLFYERHHTTVHASYHKKYHGVSIYNLHIFVVTLTKLSLQSFFFNKHCKSLIFFSVNFICLIGIAKGQRLKLHYTQVCLIWFILEENHVKNLFEVGFTLHFYALIIYTFSLMIKKWSIGCSACIFQLL